MNLKKRKKKNYSNADDESSREETEDGTKHKEAERQIEESISFNALKVALSGQPVLNIYNQQALTELHTNELQRVLNNTFQRSINRTPFEMLTGTKMRITEHATVLEAIEEEMANDYDEERDKMRKEAKASIIKVQEENKKNFDKNRKEARRYKEGDTVAVKRTQFKTKSKLLPKFLGPYIIVNCKNNNRYDLLKVGDGEGPKKTSSSADLMKPWREEDYSSESDEEQDGRVYRKRSNEESSPGD